MKNVEGIIATSHVDLHKERFALSALESLVHQINSQYISFGVEHDPRIAPLGRPISAELVNLDDGETGVKAVMQIFEPGDKIEFNGDG